MAKLLLVPELQQLPAELSCLALELCLLPALEQLLEARIVPALREARRESRAPLHAGARPAPLATALDADAFGARCVALLCKAYLHFLTGLATLPEFDVLWLKVLRVLEAFSTAKTGEAVAETLPEHLRSMLVVMASRGLLRAPASGTPSVRGGKPRGSTTLSSALASKGLWDATMSALGGFCPQLQDVLLAEAGACSQTESRRGPPLQPPPPLPQQQRPPPLPCQPPSSSAPAVSTTATSTMGAVAGRLYAFIS